MARFPSVISALCLAWAGSAGANSSCILPPDCLRKFLEIDSTQISVPRIEILEEFAYYSTIVSDSIRSWREPALGIDIRVTRVKRTGERLAAESYYHVPAWDALAMLKAWDFIAYDGRLFEARYYDDSVEYAAKQPSMIKRFAYADLGAGASKPREVLTFFPKNPSADTQRMVIRYAPEGWAVEMISSLAPPGGAERKTRRVTWERQGGDITETTWTWPESGTWTPSLRTEYGRMTWSLLFAAKDYVYSPSKSEFTLRDSRTYGYSPSGHLFNIWTEWREDGVVLPEPLIRQRFTMPTSNHEVRMETEHARKDSVPGKPVWSLYRFDCNCQPVRIEQYDPQYPAYLYRHVDVSRVYYDAASAVQPRAASPAPSPGLIYFDLLGRLRKQGPINLSH